MNKNRLKMISLITALLFVSITVFEFDALARAGRGGSFGSRGSRSYSPPKQYSSPSPSRQQPAPAQIQPAPAQPSGGGFMRGLGGGLLGGLLGGMLFSSLGFGASGGGFGGSGIGLIEIVLLLGLGYFIFRMFKKRRGGENLAYQTTHQQGYQTESYPSYGSGSRVHEDDGISHIRQMDPRFDEGLFKETAMDMFFKLQGAWMNRSLSPVQELLTDEMKSIMQKDIDSLLREKKINRLENIAVRSVKIIESWQESGQDFLTLLFTANLLDYTIDDSTAEVLEGSKTDPVKFGEFWTFTRPVGNNPWKLSAISQS